jgi:hypothetical protein
MVQGFEGLSDSILPVGESLRKSVDQILGGRGSETPEGRELMSLLLVRVLDSTQSPEELLPRLNSIKNVAHDSGRALRVTASFIFGEKPSTSPEARQFMNRLFLEVLKGSPEATTIPQVLEKVTTAFRDLSSPTPNLFDLFGFESPVERWALVEWALRTQQNPETLKALTLRIERGETDLVCEKGRLHLQEVPLEKQEGQKKHVFDRVPLLGVPSDELHTFEEMKNEFNASYQLHGVVRYNVEAMQKKLAKIEQAFGGEPEYKQEIKQIEDFLHAYVKWAQSLPDFTEHLVAEEPTGATQVEPLARGRLRQAERPVDSQGAEPMREAARETAPKAVRPPPTTHDDLTFEGTKVPPEGAVLEGALGHLLLPFGT